MKMTSCFKNDKANGSKTANKTSYTCVTELHADFLFEIKKKIEHLLSNCSHHKSIHIFFITYYVLLYYELLYTS